MKSRLYQRNFGAISFNRKDKSNSQGDDSSLPVCSVSCTVHNCLLILIYYRLGQNQLKINKYAVRSRYSSWPIKLVKD